MKSFVILTVLSWLAVTVYCRNSGVFIYDLGEDTVAFEKSINSLQKNVDIKTYAVNSSNSLENIRADVCAAMAASTNLMALLDFSKERPVNSLVEGISQRLHLPYLRLGSAYQLPHSGRGFQLQLHPGALVQLLLLRDYIEREHAAQRWDLGVILVSENTTELENYAVLTENVKQPVLIRKWTSSLDNNSQLLQDIAEQSITNFIVALEPKLLNSFFSLLSSTQRILPDHRFLLTNLDASSISLQPFAFTSADIQAIRVSTGRKTVGSMLSEVTTVAGALAERGNSLVVGAASAWTTTCGGQPWSEGARVMAGLKSEAHTKFGLIGPNEELALPTVDYTFDVLKLFNEGFVKMATWRSGVGFKDVPMEPKSRSRRQAVETLKVVVQISPPFVFETDKDAKGKKLVGNARYDGLCIKLLDRLATSLGFKYEISKSKDGMYGRSIAGGGGKFYWTGMIGEVMNKTADIAVSDLTVTSWRIKVVDFTLPYISNTLNILMRKPVKQGTSGAAFLQPLSAEIWILTLFGLIVTSLVLFATARLSPTEWSHRCHGSSIKVNQFTIAKSFWFITGAFLFRGTNLAPKATATRFVGIIWWAFTLIVIACYALNLTAFLTIERMTNPITSMEDLGRQSRIQYGAITGGSTAGFFRKSTVPYIKKMYRRMKNVNTSKDGVDLVIRNGDYAFIMESTLAEYYQARNCNLQRIESGLQERMYAFALSKGSKYVRQINEQLIKLQDEGFIKSLINKYIREDGICSLANEEGGGRVRALSVSDLRGAFVLLFVGLIVAFIVCLIELCVRAFREQDRGDKTSVGYLTDRFRLLFCTCTGRIEGTTTTHDAADVPLKEGNAGTAEEAATA